MNHLEIDYEDLLRHLQRVKPSNYSSLEYEIYTYLKDWEIKPSNITDIISVLGSLDKEIGSLDKENQWSNCISLTSFPEIPKNSAINWNKVFGNIIDHP